MNTVWLGITVAALVLLFLLYNVLIFRLVGNILDGPKVTTFFSLLLGIVNGGVLFFAAQTGISGIIYLAFLALFMFELLLTSRDRFLRVLFICLACLIHFMAIRAICTSAFSLISGAPLHSILHEDFYRVLCTAIILAVLCAAIVCVLKFVSAEKVRIINKHNEQLRFMLAWLVVFCTYFLLSSRIYSVSTSYPLLNELQILSSVAILIGLYIVLFFSFRISALLGYEATNKLLSADLQKERQYRAAIISDSLATYEFNLSGNQIVAGFDHYKESLGENLVSSYSEMLDFLAGKMVLYEDIPAFLNFVSVGNLLRTLAIHKSELALEYRRLSGDGDYIWVRAITDLARDDVTGEVRGFTYIKDINKEKLTQLDLKYRAERDSLTGLYNKGMTARLINERLKKGNEFNALLIVDIDDFKSVNDRYGHAYGDTVLCELAERMLINFRKEDIIGRVGGDEFVAFLTNTRNLDAVKQKATELCDSMRDAVDSLTFSISVGIAVSPANGMCFDDLYINADTALYTSKKSGKDGYTVFA